MTSLKILALAWILLAIPATADEAVTVPPKADTPAGDAPPKNADADPDANKNSKEEGKVEVAKCSKALLEAYDVESGWNTVKDQNFLCPAVKKLNCCSYHAQLDIYRKWVIKGEKERIVRHYK